MNRRQLDPLRYAWEALHRTPFPLTSPDTRVAAMEAFHKAHGRPGRQRKRRP